MELIPQLLFVLIVLGFVILAAYDYQRVIQLFDEFNQWLSVEPVLSSIAIFFLYIGLVVIAFPIMYLTIALGFSFT
jgi:hypothetical protein